MATTPTSAPEIGHIGDSHIYRKKAASLQGIVRFSPYKLPQNGSSLFNLSGHSPTHPNPLPPTINLPVVSQPPTFTTEGETFIHTTHVQPGFNLYRDGVQCSPSTAQFKQMKELFPTCFKVSFSPPFIIIVCKVFPTKPWPVTVAGIPAWLTDDENADPRDIWMNAFGPKVSLQAPIKIWVPATKAVAREILTILRGLGAPISKLRWLGWCFLVLAPKAPFDDWRVRLPRTINNIHVGYIFREGVLQEKALRRKVPFEDVPDNEACEILRPGVMVSKKSLGEQYDDMMTTSGVCVQSPDGEKYITLAHRGFPTGIDEPVYHPDRSGKIIGEIAKVFRESDIALAKLDPAYQYSRETFSAADATVVPFGNIADTEKLPIGCPTYMDTPFNGRLEGNLITIEFQELLGQEETRYIVGLYSYFGNGTHTILDGCCGGVLWDDNHDVLGQFSYLKEGTGKCYGPSFDLLRAVGYTLAEI